MSPVVRFDCFEADLSAGLLRKRGTKIHLRDKSFQVLVALLEHPGEVVTREQLQQRLWRDEVFVDFENNLNTAVGRLREALGDSAERPRFVETVPRRGYRFLASVSERPPTEISRRVKLLVLPFRNLSGNAAAEYFAEGILDELISALAAVAPDQLAVIARTTAMRYKDSQKDVARLGRELKVDYVVEGAFRRGEDRIAISVQLIQTSDQTHLFARKYTAGVREVFSTQDSIAETIAGHIPALATRARAGAMGVSRSAKQPTKNLAAYSEYLQGRNLMARLNAQTFAAAKQHFERAIARDPEFALAYDALAELYWYLGYLGITSAREAFAAGIVHALRALEIDTTRAETHALLGQFHKTIEYNWPEVHREMTLALQLDPNSPLVRMRHAVSWLMPQGRIEEAVVELERALEFDPLSLLARMWFAIMLVLRQDYDRGLEEGQKLLELDPSYYPAHFIMALCWRYQNRYQEAVAALRQNIAASGSAATMGWLGVTLAESGQVAEARDLLRRLHGIAAQGYVPPCSFAWIHFGLKEIDAAFEWLNRAVEECDQLLMPIKTYRFFAPIRDDPRFAALLHKMNLEA